MEKITKLDKQLHETLKSFLIDTVRISLSENMTNEQKQTMQVKRLLIATEQIKKVFKINGHEQV
jgi:hypothetical protein